MCFSLRHWFTNFTRLSSTTEVEGLMHTKPPCVWFLQTSLWVGAHGADTTMGQLWGVILEHMLGVLDWKAVVDGGMQVL